LKTREDIALKLTKVENQSVAVRECFPVWKCRNLLVNFV